MKKKSIIVAVGICLLAIVALIIFIPSQKKEDVSNHDKINVNIAALKGPTAMGMAKVMEDAKSSNTYNNYQFTLAGAADEITASLVKGDLDIAAIPCNLASVLYNKTEGNIKVAAVNTLGVLYILEMGNQIQKVSDLKGKTIYTTGKGTTPEYILNYLLTSNGLNPNTDLDIIYMSEPTEVVASLAKEEDVVAMLPQPFVTTVTMNNPKVRVALDLTKEWESTVTNDSSIVTGVVIVRKEFLEKNPEAVQEFLKEYKASVEYVNTNVEDAASIIEEYGIVKAEVAKKAIPYCNITFLQGEEMEAKMKGYLEILYEQDPKIVGGKLPDEAFYYKE